MSPSSSLSGNFPTLLFHVSEYSPLLYLFCKSYSTASNVDEAWLNP